MHPLMMQLLSLIYPIQSPNKKRDRPLEVLALGISRSGTESLRQALVELGYQDVYHGFTYSSSPNDCYQWIRLSQAQARNDKSGLSATEFDKILGTCAAVTDMPPAGFAHELLDAYLPLYPNIKIILNYREDLAAWKRSCENTLEKVVGLYTWTDWFEHILDFFQSNLFWMFRSYWWVWSRHFGSNFKANGQAWYKNHYESLEQRLPAGSYLKWKVEDGWEPLCEHLGKPIPDRDFPTGNVPAKYFETVNASKAEAMRQAKRNMLIVGSVLVVLIATWFAWFLDLI